MSFDHESDLAVTHFRSSAPLSSAPFSWASSYGHGGGAPGMNGELHVFPELGYVVVSLSNLDPPAASELVEFFTLRMPDQ
jgi:hypothetical protein